MAYCACVRPEFGLPPVRHNTAVPLLLLFVRLSWSLQNKIMLTKNKLRRLNPEQLAELANKDTVPSNLQLCQELLSDKNALLKSQRQALINDIFLQRHEIEKTVIELQDSMKQKLRLNQRLVMDRCSRPGAQQMGKLTQIFEVTQKQSLINARKDQHIGQLSEQLGSAIEKYRRKLEKQMNTSDLDSQYSLLRSQCEAETIELEKLIRQRDGFRATYASVGGEIDQARIDYEEVEARVRTAQRELIQLSAYFEERSREDRQALQQLEIRASQLEEELLKGQTLVNSNRERQKFLEIQMIQVESLR